MFTKKIIYLKLLLLLIFSSVIIYLNDLYLLFIFLLFILIFTFILSKEKIISRLKALFFIFLLIILLQLFFNISLTFYQRIEKGLLSAIKIVLLSLSVFCFTTLTSISEILLLFSFLPKQLQLMLTVTFSFIPTIFKENYQIYLVQSCRGFNRHKIKNLLNIFPLIIPLLHRIFKRAEQIAIILPSRGYQNE